MSANEQVDRERVRALMMAALDDELSPGERQELDRSLDADASLREEWDCLRRVKEVTRGMHYIKPPDGVWETYWDDSFYNRAERGLGWVLLFAGTIALVGYGIWAAVRELLADSGVPGSIKLAIAAVAIGGFVLLFSVLREKLAARRTDPYKEVQR